MLPKQGSHKGKIVIAFVIDRLEGADGLTGGTERQLIDTVNRLDLKRFHPILVCLRGNQKSVLWKGLDFEKHMLHVQTLLAPSGILSLFKFVCFLRRRSVDIVQTFFIDATFFGVIAATIARVRWVISCRRDMGFWYDRKTIRLLRWLNCITNRILVNSHAIKENVVRREFVRSDRIDVIYNGIDLNRIKQITAASLSAQNGCFQPDFIIGTVANYNRPVKRVDLLIRSAEVILQKYPYVKFAIVGGGVLEDELKALADSLGVRRSIIFTGKQDNAVQYIKAFQIGVLTSDSEGFSNVLMEYMGAGIPVVATDIGGNPELVRHGVDGILVPRGNQHAIADACCYLINNEALREKMGNNGLQRIVENFSWERRVVEIQHYYLSRMRIK